MALLSKKKWRSNMKDDTRRAWNYLTSEARRLQVDIVLDNEQEIHQIVLLEQKTCLHQWFDADYAGIMAAIDWLYY
jgi:hypothetical protein